MYWAGPTARTLDDRVAQLEGELTRVEHERGILKKALSILSHYFNSRLQGHGGFVRSQLIRRGSKGTFRRVPKGTWWL